MIVTLKNRTSNLKSSVNHISTHKETLPHKVTATSKCFLVCCRRNRKICRGLGTIHELCLKVVQRCSKNTCEIKPSTSREGGVQYWRWTVLVGGGGAVNRQQNGSGNGKIIVSGIYCYLLCNVVYGTRRIFKNANMIWYFEKGVRILDVEIFG